MSKKLKRALISKGKNICIQEKHALNDSKDSFFLAVDLENPIESLCDSFTRKRIKDNRIKIATETFVKLLIRQISQGISKDQLSIIGVSLILIIGFLGVILLKLPSKDKHQNLVFWSIVMMEVALLIFLAFVALKWCQKRKSKQNLIQNWIESYNNRIKQDDLKFNYIPGESWIFIEVKMPEPEIFTHRLSGHNQGLDIIYEVDSELYKSDNTSATMSTSFLAI